MTNIYFVRHAHSVYTPEELTRPLSEVGRKDSQRITKILEGKNIDYILSSPYKRAIQTVEGLAEVLNKEITLVEDFKERKLAGKPVEDFQMAISKVWEDYSFSHEGGESNIVAQKRGITALKQVLNVYEDKNIVIATHGNIMSLMMNYFNKNYDLTFWENLQMPDIYMLSFNRQEFIDAKQIW